MRARERAEAADAAVSGAAGAEAGFALHRGDAPLLLSIPHAGTELDDELAQRLTPEARALPDTDWHLPLLYDFAASLGATILTARRSRYVIDLNRPPDDASLYPGRATTGLVPMETFAGAAIYRDGAAPAPAEIAARRERDWRPYHEALAAELARLRQRFGTVVLWDAHSIASRVPRLFEGRLPDLNLGTADGTSCDGALRAALMARLAAQQAWSFVVDGRFKGGYITRHYGQPRAGVHAVQLEMCCSTYMEEEAPFAWDAERAAAGRAVVRGLVEGALDWVRRR